MGKMLGGEEEKDPDAAKKEEERQEALRQQEEERKAKYAKMESEREVVRQGIRDKVGFAVIRSRESTSCGITRVCLENTCNRQHCPENSESQFGDDEYSAINVPSRCMVCTF